MKHLIILLLSVNAFANIELTGVPAVDVKADEAFTDILMCQNEALEKMEDSARGLPGGFKLTELITDIAVNKEGLLGIAALKSNSGVEIKWKKIEADPAVDAVDFVIEADPSMSDLSSMTDSITALVKSSKRVKKTSKIRKRVSEALLAIDKDMKAIGVTRFNHWEVKGLRLDLNFSTNGELWFFAKAGVAVRVRLEWKLNDRPMQPNQTPNVNRQTRFVLKTLGELDKAALKYPLKSFEIAKISLGVGSSIKKGFFGLWKYSAGFVGFMIFTPVEPAMLPMNPVAIPKALEMSMNSWWWPFGGTNRYIDFRGGVEKSVKKAASFAEKADRMTYKRWKIAEIKSFFDVSKTGFFGLADVTAKGPSKSTIKGNNHEIYFGITHRFKRFCDTFFG